MSNPGAPSSKLKDQRLRKKCQDMPITTQDLWPSIRLHGIRLLIKLNGIKLQGIRLFNIKPLGIMLHGPRLFSISGLSRDLFLPIIVANPRPLKSRRRMRMINTTMSYLFA
jgi:hypothetical protein